MVMMGVSTMFVDTNVLIYATNTVAPWYKIANIYLDEARNEGVDLVISPQIIREYLAASTRSHQLTGSPTLSDIWTNVSEFRTKLRLVYNAPSVLDNLTKLLQTIPTAGKQVHDANIVATMQAYNIEHLLTHNVSDFSRFAGLITIVPLVPTP
jgi:predicted nucleic acid-binding protein